MYDLSRAADRDLVNLYLWGAERFGPDRAEQYIEGLTTLFELLAGHPAMACELRQFDPPVRVHPFGSHVIVYKVQDDRILIVRIRHAREDWLADPEE